MKQSNQPIETGNERANAGVESRGKDKSVLCGPGLNSLQKIVITKQRSTTATNLDERDKELRTVADATNGSSQCVDLLVAKRGELLDEATRERVRRQKLAVDHI